MIHTEKCATDLEQITSKVRLLTTAPEKIFLSTAGKNYPSKRNLALKKGKKRFLVLLFQSVSKKCELVTIYKVQWVNTDKYRL